MGRGYRTCNQEWSTGGKEEEGENCHGQPNLFSVAAFRPEMQAHEVRDDALIYMSPWQVFQPLTHLEAEYREAGEPKCDDPFQSPSRSLPNFVICSGTKLKESSEQENRKN